MLFVIIFINSCVSTKPVTIRPEIDCNYDKDKDNEPSCYGRARIWKDFLLDI